jgi:hypothetical protein
VYAETASPPRISLLGSAVVLLTPAEAQKYSDPGASCADDKDGDLSQTVSDETKIPNDISQGKPGKYFVKYSCTNAAGLNTVKTRDVIVGAKRALAKYSKNPHIPHLVVRGANPRYIVAQDSNADILEEFTDLDDAMCHDGVDGDLTKKIKARLFQVIVGKASRKHLKKIRGDMVGTFVIQYSCANGLGLKAVATRDVIITKFPAPKPTQGGSCGTCGIPTLKRCKSLVMRGPECEKCLQDETEKCSEEQVDTFCYAHVDDDTKALGPTDWSAFAAAAKLAECHLKPSDGCKKSIEQKCSKTFETGPTCQKCIDSKFLDMIVKIEQGKKAECTKAELKDFCFYAGNSESKDRSQYNADTTLDNKAAQDAPKLKLFGKSLVKVPVDKHTEYVDHGAGCNDPKEGDMYVS